MGKRPGLSAVLYMGAAFLAGSYFTFAAVQGDYGLLRRIEVEATRARLELEHQRLAAEVARMENLTRRLSDDYIDLDLLDERARDVLGLLRADEIVIR